MLEIKPSFQTTYEELKRLFDGTARGKVRGFQTTYEELKRECDKRVYAVNVCFQTTYEELKRSVYEREGWSEDSFQTTYEELKHCDTEYTPVGNNSGFQTTYEELKLCGNIFTYHKIRGFQTTYEELKQVFCASMIRNASSLPDYLWGIETTGYSTCSSVIALPDYLWGIETSWFSLPFPFLPRFQTTYEELKLLLLAVLKNDFSASRLPMRNWNLIPYF